MASTDEFFPAIDAGDVEGCGRSSRRTRRSRRHETRRRVGAHARAIPARQAARAGILRAPGVDVFEAAAFGDLDRLPSSWTRIRRRDRPLRRRLQPPAPRGVLRPAWRSAESSRPRCGRRRAGKRMDDRHAASLGGGGSHTDVVRILLDAGADRTRGSRAGRPRCMGPRMNGTSTTSELLLAHGADPSAANDDGATGWSLAEKSGDTDVIARSGRRCAPERSPANANSCATESHGLPRPNVIRMSVTSATHQKHVTEPSPPSLGVAAEGIGRVLVVREDLAQRSSVTDPAGCAASSSRRARVADGGALRVGGVALVGEHRVADVVVRVHQMAALVGLGHLDRRSRSPRRSRRGRPTTRARCCTRTRGRGGAPCRPWRRATCRGASRAPGARAGYRSARRSAPARCR